MTIGTQSVFEIVSDQRHDWSRDGLLLMMRSGLRTPDAAMPIPAFAVPYAAPRQERHIASAHPRQLKKGCWRISGCSMFGLRFVLTAYTGLEGKLENHGLL
jgi:hypothetical protein